MLFEVMMAFMVQLAQYILVGNLRNGSTSLSSQPFAYRHEVSRSQSKGIMEHWRLLLYYVTAREQSEQAIMIYLLVKMMSTRRVSPIASRVRIVRLDYTYVYFKSTYTCSCSTYVPGGNSVGSISIANPALDDEIHNFLIL